jgi:hypothetical protein
LQKWNSLLQDAVLNSGHSQKITGVCGPGFRSVTDITDFLQLATCSREALRFERICTRPQYLTPTTRRRFSPPAANKNRPKWRGYPPVSYRVNGGYVDPDSTISCEFQHVPSSAPADSIHIGTRAWGVDKPLTMHYTAVPLSLVVFTDGSSIPGSRKCGGHASIIFDEAETIVATL